MAPSSPTRTHPSKRTCSSIPGYPVAWKIKKLPYPSLNAELKALVGGVVPLRGVGVGVDCN